MKARHTRADTSVGSARKCVRHDMKLWSYFRVSQVTPAPQVIAVHSTLRR
jgi:hypothetical protein